MTELIFKTVSIYFFLLILVRIMGKREIGQLSPFDFVVAIMIAEMAVFPIEEEKMSLIHGITPIGLLVIMEIVISYISLKSNFLRGIITGRPQILIEKGKINYSNLKKTRYNINDLLMQLRIKNIFSIDDVELAILEVSGQLSVLSSDDIEYGFPVIIDGRISNREIITGVSKKWVRDQVKIKGVCLSDIVLATVDRNNEMKIYYKM